MNREEKREAIVYFGNKIYELTLELMNNGRIIKYEQTPVYLFVEIMLSAHMSSIVAILDGLPDTCENQEEISDLKKELDRSKQEICSGFAKALRSDINAVVKERIK